jgi:hypothetical protein
MDTKFQTGPSIRILHLRKAQTKEDHLYMIEKKMKRISKGNTPQGSASIRNKYSHRKLGDFVKLPATLVAHQYTKRKTRKIDAQNG